MLDWVWSHSGTLADIATVMGALVAGIALGFAWAQILSQRAAQRESHAKALYQQYLRLAFENPKLATPALSDIDLETKTLDGDRIAFDRYEWFVSMLLDAGEEIIHLAPSKAWRTTVSCQILEHAAYLRRYFDDYAEEYEGEFRQFVRRALEAG